MTEENKEQKEKHRSPFLWIGIIVALMALILILSLWQPTKKKQDQLPPTEPTIAQVEKKQQQEQIAKTTDDKAKFPLVAWFAIVAATLLLRAGVELYYIWTNKEKENIWIGLDMLCIGLVSLSVIISFLYIDKPEEWWNNIWAEKGPGKFLLITLGLTLILWFILPGTGSLTLKLGKPFCIIIGLGLITILVFTATGGELKYEDKDGKDRWFWQKRFKDKVAEAKIPPTLKTVPFKDFNLTKTEKFIGIINPGEQFQYISPVWFYLKTETGKKVPYMPSQNPGEIRYIQSDFGRIPPGGYRLYIRSKDQAAIIKYRFK